METVKIGSSARSAAMGNTATIRAAEQAVAEAQRRLDSIDVTAVMTRIPAIRARLGELAELRREAEKAPVPATVVAERANRLVSGLAAECLERLPVHLLCLAREQPIHNEFVGRQLVDRFTVTGLHLAAWLDPAQLISKLTEAAAARAQDMPEPLDQTERAQRVAACDEEEAALLAEEVDLLWSLDAVGLPAPWRSDLPPRLVMGLPA